MGRKRKELVEKVDNTLIIRKEYFRRNEVLNLSAYTTVYAHMQNGLLGDLNILKSSKNRFYFFYAEDSVFKSNEVYFYSRNLQEVLDYINDIGLAGRTFLKVYEPKSKAVVKEKKSKLA